MARLIITRGLPGSGKTTRAKAWVDESPKRRARVNRDDIRDMLHGGWLGSDVQEDQVTAVAHPAIEALLRSGSDVVCDDTNLYDSHVLQLAAVATRAGAGFEVWDMTDVPVEVCVARDAERGLAGGRYVGEKPIVAMWRRHIWRHGPRGRRGGR